MFFSPIFSNSLGGAWTASEIHRNQTHAHFDSDYLMIILCALLGIIGLYNYLDFHFNFKK